MDTYDKARRDLIWIAKWIAIPLASFFLLSFLLVWSGTIS